MAGIDDKVQKLFEFCASGDRIGLADYILTSGCNPSSYDMRNSLGQTALHIACQHGNLHTVKALIVAFGCSPDVTDNKGNLPFHFACVHGHLAIVNLMIEKTRENEKYADTIFCSDLDGNTALHKACQSGEISIVRYITDALARGSIRQKTSLYLDSVALYEVEEITSLRQHSILKKQHPLVQEAFVSLNTAGDSPLHVACRHGHLNVLKAYSHVILSCNLLPSLISTACRCGYSSIFTYLASIQTSEAEKDFQVDFLSESQYTALGSELHCVHDRTVGKCDLCCHLHSNNPPFNTLSDVLQMQRKFSIVFECPKCFHRGEVYRGNTRVICKRCQSKLFDEQADFLIFCCSACTTPFRFRENMNYFLACPFCNSECYSLRYELVNCYQKKSTEKAFFKQSMSGVSVLRDAALCGNYELVQTILESHHSVATNVSTMSSACLSACITNNTSLVKLFVDKYKCSINLTNSEGNSPLHIACMWQATDVAEYLLSHDQCDENIQNKAQHTPLHYACANKLPKICGMLVKRNCSLNVKTKSSKETPLHQACCYPDINLLKNLASHPELSLVINSTDAYGDSPLFNACRTGEVAIVKLLVDKGADPLLINEHTKEMPVHIACRMERLDILQVLLPEGVFGNLSQQNLLGATPIHLAVEKQSAPIIKFLVDGNYCKADVTLNNIQSTLLHLACYRIHSVVETLLEQLTDYDKQDQKGNTALHIACYSEKPEVVKLVSQYCSVSIQNKDLKTPVHISCQLGDVESVQYMLLRSPDSLNELADSNSDTVLHVACTRGSLDLVKLLLKHCSVTATNKIGETPIHIACRLGKADIVDCLVRETSGSLDSFTNVDGDTVLHVAAKNDVIEVVKSLLCVGCCSVTQLNSAGFTPIHIFCAKKNLPITKLFAENGSEAVPSIEEGFTYLHMACHFGSFPIVKFLVEESGIDRQQLLQKDVHLSSPLHQACLNGHMEIVRYLVAGKHCSIYDFKKDGFSPIGLAIASGKSGFVQEVILEGLVDIRKECREGYPLLHCLMQQMTIQNYKLLRFLAAKNYCTSDVISQCDTDGNTVLHCAVKCVLDLLSQDVPQDSQISDYQHFSTFFRKSELLYKTVWTVLLSLANEDILIKCNSSGDSLLHLLCKLFAQASKRPSTKIWLSLIFDSTEKLLKKGCLLPSMTCHNKEGKSPIQLVVNHNQIIRLLVLYGANPNDVYENCKYFIDQSKKRSPLDPKGKILLLGHSKAGKSTLIKALSTDDVSVTDVVETDGPTKGVVTTHYRSAEIGNIWFHEFAGQPEYEIGNSTFLENALCGLNNLEQSLTFMILVDVSKSSSLSKDLRYWVYHIENHCPPNLKNPPFLVALGSHIDCVSSDDHSTIQQAMKHALEQTASKKFEVCDPILLDCRKTGSDEVKKLKAAIKESYIAFKECFEIDCRCHALFTVLVDIFRGRDAVKFGEVQLNIHHNSHTSDLLLPFQTDALQSLVEKLHSGGHVVFLKGSQKIENSWIVVNQSSLFTNVNGTLFASESHGRPAALKTNTGVVSLQTLNKLFPSMDINLVTGFLVYSELCLKITDTETLQLITKDAVEYSAATVTEPMASSPSQSQQYYFFPSFVKSDRPGDIWDMHFTYVCGWCLNCRPYHFLDARFLHVLQLRLMFTFAAVSKATDTTTDVSLERRCDVWKNGIHWSTRSGVDVIVEVVEQTMAVLIIRCSPGQEMGVVKYRSAVIKKILQTKQQFCQTAEADEFFFRPSSLQISNYPDVLSIQAKVHICEIIEAFSSSEPCHGVIDSNNKSLMLTTLLHFDPYMLIGKDNIEVLHSPTEPESEVADDFLYSLAKSHFSHINELVAILEVPSTEVDVLREKWRDTPIRLLHQIFASWKTRVPKPTYHVLCEEFDKHSIFCGRNPLTAKSGILQSLDSNCGTTSDVKVTQQPSASLPILTHPQPTSQLNLPSLDPHAQWPPLLSNEDMNRESEYLLPRYKKVNSCHTQ